MLYVIQHIKSQIITYHQYKPPLNACFKAMSESYTVSPSLYLLNYMHNQKNG